jgi:hypothetical protein
MVPHDSRFLAYLRPILTHLKEFGAAGVILGLAAWLLTVFFKAAVAFVFIGFGLWIIHVWVEEKLLWGGKTVVTVIILLLPSLFAYYVVLFPAPLQIGSTWTVSDYSPGTDIHGIKWAPGYSEVRVLITDPSDRDYDSFDFSIRSSEGVTGIAEVSSIPCVPLTSIPHVTDDGSNIYGLILDTGPRRFRCDKVPKHATIEFVLAVVNADDDIASVQQNKKPPLGLNGLWGAKRKPKWIYVTGSYLVTFKPHFVSKVVNVDG